jgi:hypothetical protein
MFRVTLSSAVILAVCLSAMAVTQKPASKGESALTARVERSVKEKEPEWKASRLLSNGNRVVKRWKSGNEEVLVSVHEYRTGDEAADEMSRAVKAVSVPGKPLEKLGDEAYVWAAYTESGRSAVRFRKSNVFVSVSAPSLGLAKKFARHIAGEIEGEGGEEKTQSPD